MAVGFDAFLRYYDAESARLADDAYYLEALRAVWGLSGRAGIGAGAVPNESFDGPASPGRERAARGESRSCVRNQNFASRPDMLAWG